MNDSNRSHLESPADEEALPADLLRAIDRARQLKATPSMTDELIAKLSAIEKNRARSDGFLRRWKGHAVWASAIAACLVLALTFALWRLPRGRDTVHIPKSSPSEQNRYSTIKTISLVSVTYRKIDEELDRAEQAADDAFREMTRTAIRREIQEVLEEYYDWSN